MHSYMRAIGFREALSSESEVELLLDNLLHTYDKRIAVREEETGKVYLELSKSYGPNIGIRMYGELDEQGFHRVSYFPYLTGSGVTSREEITIEKRAGGEGYSGMIEDGRVDASLIFFLQNPGETQRAIQQDKLISGKPQVTLCALSLDGMILLPGKKSGIFPQEDRKEYYRKRDKMVIAAKNGNQEAIENLTLEDMDTYAMISRRIQYEDVLTIVDTFFMPCGMECDLYKVMGTILYCAKVQNSVTKETLCQMTIESNGITFDVVINQNDLTGEPAPGRRFKGSIWLQGSISTE